MRAPPLVICHCVTELKELFPYFQDRTFLRKDLCLKFSGVQQNLFNFPEQLAITPFHSSAKDYQVMRYTGNTIARTWQTTCRFSFCNAHVRRTDVPGLHWMSIQKETGLFPSREDKSSNIHSVISPKSKSKTKPEYIWYTKGPCTLMEKYNLYVKSYFLVFKDNGWYSSNITELYMNSNLSFILILILWFYSIRPQTFITPSLLKLNRQYSFHWGHLSEKLVASPTSFQSAFLHF